MFFLLFYLLFFVMLNAIPFSPLFTTCSYVHHVYSIKKKMGYFVISLCMCFIPRMLSCHCRRRRMRNFLFSVYRYFPMRSVPLFVWVIISSAFHSLTPSSCFSPWKNTLSGFTLFFSHIHSPLDNIYLRLLHTTIHSFIHVCVVFRFR